MVCLLFYFAYLYMSLKNAFFPHYTEGGKKIKQIAQLPYDRVYEPFRPTKSSANG